MGNSLLEQLQKVGLVDDQRARQAQQEKRKQAKTRKGKKAAPPDPARTALQQAQAQKAARDRELERDRARAAERKAVAAQIRQLVAAHRVAMPDAELPFNFADGDKVRRLHVTAPVRGDLVRGRLAIVRADDGYAVVPREAAEKIRQRDAAALVLLNAGEEPRPAADDPYADYPVPDDLVW